MQAGQVGADAPPGEVSSVATAQLVPTAEPTSPSAVYTVARFAANQFFTGVKERLRGRDFATVHAHHAGAAGTTFTKNAGGIPPDNSSLNFVGVSYTGLFNVTEHYFGRGFQWITSLEQTGDFFSIAGLDQIVDYHAGQTTTEQWNRAPLSPAFFGVHEGPFGVLGAPRREGDVVIADVSLFSDASRPPHEGFTNFFDTSPARLLRDDVVIEDIDGLASPFASFEATPESAEYRIEQEVTRSSEQFDLSTEITRRSRSAPSTPTRARSCRCPRCGSRRRSTSTTRPARALSCCRSTSSAWRARRRRASRTTRSTPRSMTARRGCTCR